MTGEALVHLRDDIPTHIVGSSPTWGAVLFSKATGPMSQEKHEREAIVEITFKALVQVPLGTKEPVPREGERLRSYARSKVRGSEFDYVFDCHPDSIPDDLEATDFEVVSIQ